MKNIILKLCLVTGLAIGFTASSQQRSTPEIATAARQQYNTLYVLNQSDETKIKDVIRSITHVMEDPRLKGKLHVVLLAFGDGVELYKKSNPYEKLLLPLKEKGVVFMQCENTMKVRNISKDQLYPFVMYTPSAGGEIIIRQNEGWAIMKP